jgi:hypothetical protein
MPRNKLRVLTVDEILERTSGKSRTGGTGRTPRTPQTPETPRTPPPQPGLKTSKRLSVRVNNDRYVRFKKWNARRVLKGEEQMSFQEYFMMCIDNLDVE